MNTNTEQIEETFDVVATRHDGNIEVTAETPEQMRQSNQALIAWCDAKIRKLTAEASELQAAYEHAVKQKWKSGVLKTHWARCGARTEYFKKIKLALECGYYIVPNFPVTAFVIRTDAKNPKKGTTTYKWSTHLQTDAALPAGEGENKNPLPAVYERDITNEAQKAAGKEVIQYFAKHFEDLEFPVNMAKPRIMEATSRAMALKLFDEIGVLPDGRKKADPVIIGRIRNPNSRFINDNNRWVSFIIAWHLDTETL